MSQGVGGNVKVSFRRVRHPVLVDKDEFNFVLEKLLYIEAFITERSYLRSIRRMERGEKQPMS